MKSFFILIIISLSLFSINTCLKEAKPKEETEIKSENNVLILTLDNFDIALKKYSNLVVLFYVPYCSHCKTFLPDYDKAATELIKSGLPLAKLECDFQGKICTKYNIKAYPTLKLFSKGSPKDYKGEISIDKIMEWMKEETRPSYTTLNNITETQIFKNRNEISVLYFGKNETEINEFINISEKYKKIPFGVVSFDEGIKEYAENYKGGFIIVFKQFFNQRPRLTLTDQMGEREIERFVKEHTEHQVLPYSGQIGYILFGRRYPGLILFAEEKSEKWFDYLNLMGNILPKVGDKIKVITADINSKKVESLMETLNVKKKDIPCVKIVEAKRNRKYLLEGEINEENLLKFYQDWIDNKLKPDLRSEREPPENEKYEKNVMVVVTTTFEKDVIKNDKDVFVMYYSSAKWSCKEFMPKYEEFAGKLKGNDGLIVAKVDLLLNELDGLNVQLVPNFKLYKGNQKDKEPIEYNGDKSIDDMIKFLKENAYHKIENEENKENKEKTGDL